MGFVSRMARPKAISREMEKVLREHFTGGGVTTSGTTVSNETAMRHATVYSCVNILSRVIGMLPCHMMERVGDQRNQAREFYLYEKIHDLPNEWMTAQDFWSMCISHLVLRGNFFALKEFDRYGRINGLIPLAPDVVYEVKQTKNYNLEYYIQVNGQTFSMPQRQMMHIKGMTMNGYMGVNPIEYIRESVGLGLATEEFGARYFGSGTHPGMIVEHPGKLSEAASKNLRESLVQSYSGLGKSHKLMLLEEGMKAHAITINPEDSQFLDIRRYQKDEIVDIFFGMPLTVMNSGNNTPTFASAEQFSIGFVIYALLPWIVNIEKAIFKDLLTHDERKKYYAKFKVEGLQRGAFKDQMDAFATGITKEIFSPNEVRDFLDMNPYPGGDVYAPRTSTTRTDKESAGETK